jgi:hypothetical protein
MKKVLITGMALAMLAIPAVASADVPRHQTQTGSLTVTLPEYNLVHTFTDVVVNPCEDGSFTGVSGTRDVGEITEEVSGTIKDGKISFEATYTSQQENGYQWHTIEPGAFNTTFRATDSNGLDFDVIVTSDLTPSNYKNHGQYVAAQGGGDDAAHSCIGMPINSNQ